MGIICQHCKTENSDGAKHCNKCGMAFTNGNTQNGRGLPMLQANTSLLGYQIIEMTYNDGIRNLYRVLNIGPEGQQIRVCSNPNCGAFHRPMDGDLESFCTACNSPMANGNTLLQMIQKSTPPAEVVTTLIERNLTHGGLSLPLVSFIQNGAYYLITPPVNPLPGEIEAEKLLEDGICLAYAMRVLHVSGVSFEGQIGKKNLGWINNHLVWDLLENGYTVTAAAAPVSKGSMKKDVIGLSRLLFALLTGRTEFAPQSGLFPPLEAVFQRALVEQRIETPAELGAAIEEALQQQTTTGSLEFVVGRLTDVGRQRQLNEDSLMALEMNIVRQSQGQPRGVFAVADGMGGHAAGEVASGLIVQSLLQNATTELFPKWSSGSPVNVQKWLTDAVLAANKDVYDHGKGVGVDMGSTLAMAVLDGVTAHIAHVGDSRVYRVNHAGIMLLTTDHSLVERLVATGQITREQARHHDQKNVIYRTMGDKLNLEVENATHTLAPGDWLLICSDGLSGMVDDPYLHQIIIGANSPMHACEKLVEAANQAGGDDNITVVLVKIIENKK